MVTPVAMIGVNVIGGMGSGLVPPPDLRLGGTGPFEFRHFLGQNPKGLIELDVLIDAVDGAGAAPAASTLRIPAHSPDATPDHVLLRDIERGPKVFAAVISATWF